MGTRFGMDLLVSYLNNQYQYCHDTGHSPNRVFIVGTLLHDGGVGGFRRFVRQVLLYVDKRQLAVAGAIIF